MRLFVCLLLIVQSLVSSWAVLGTSEEHPASPRHHHFSDAVSSAAKAGLGLAREGGDSDKGDPLSPREDPRSFWRKLLDKVTGKDSPSMIDRMQEAAELMATDAAGAKAKEPLKKVKEYGESAQEVANEVKDAAEGARLEAATQAEAASEMAKEAAKEKAGHVVEAASSASNVAARKAADAGESLDESLRKAAAEAPKYATASAADAVQKGAQTVEEQAESLRKWSAEQKQEL